MPAPPPATRPRRHRQGGGGLLSKKAALGQARVAVEVASANVEVAESDAKRLEAWVGYLSSTAPFDGVVVARNANTGDFVMPASGDPTADHHSPHLSPGGNAAPIYVIDRTDVVRIFVDMPEHDANYIHGESSPGKNDGTKATVLVKAFRDQPIPASVTRTSWALNVKSRTLRAEIDLPNTDAPMVHDDLGQHQPVGNSANSGSQILPGMYAYGKVIIERPSPRRPRQRARPCRREVVLLELENGHAVRTEVQTGVSDGEWIEVTNRQLPPKPNGDDPWAPVDGTEQVILGDLSVLTDGAMVSVLSGAGEPNVAEAEPVSHTTTR